MINNSINNSLVQSRFPTAMVKCIYRYGRTVEVEKLTKMARLTGGKQ